jgi:hypothetical protein
MLLIVTFAVLITSVVPVLMAILNLMEHALAVVIVFAQHAPHLMFAQLAL